VDNGRNEADRSPGFIDSEPLSDLDQLCSGGFGFGVGAGLNILHGRHMARFRRSHASAGARTGSRRPRRRLQDVPRRGAGCQGDGAPADRGVRPRRFPHLVHGHFTGVFRNVAGKGQPINFIATDILRVRDGKITDNGTSKTI
jgi:hypothetical protein